MLESLILPAYFLVFLSIIGAIATLYFLTTRIDDRLRAPFAAEDGKRLLRRVGLFWAMGCAGCAAYYFAVRTESALLTACVAVTTIVFAGLFAFLLFQYRLLATQCASRHERYVGRVYLAIAFVGYSVVYVGELCEIVTDLRTSTAVQPLLTALIFWLMVLHPLGLAHRSAIRRKALPGSAIHIGN